MITWNVAWSLNLSCLKWPIVRLSSNRSLSLLSLLLLPFCSLHRTYFVFLPSPAKGEEWVYRDWSAMARTPCKDSRGGNRFGQSQHAGNLAIRVLDLLFWNGWLYELFAGLFEELALVGSELRGSYYSTHSETSSLYLRPSLFPIASLVTICHEPRCSRHPLLHQVGCVFFLVSC